MKRATRRQRAPPPKRVVVVPAMFMCVLEVEGVEKTCCSFAVVCNKQTTKENIARAAFLLKRVKAKIYYARAVDVPPCVRDQ